MPQTYHEETKLQYTLRQRELQKELPTFVGDFFRSVADTTTAKTRVGYAYDFKIFFTFLSEECNGFEPKPASEYTTDDMKKVTLDHLEHFMEYLTYYIKNVRVVDTNNAVVHERQYEHQNKERGKYRKLSAVRALFSYLYKKGKLDANPTELVNTPKLRQKSITRLEVDEVAKLLDEVESGEKLTDRQKAFHDNTKVRDLAIVTLLLGTGMRVSECVGIDLNDVDFNEGAIKVIRKGDKEAVIYFGDEVRDALGCYVELRKEISALPGHENALFLSLQKKRITDRAVQNLVKKYSRLVTTLKNISPHKLRSTYGTQLYLETGDIYLVADVLGHSDVNTTKKHYADIDNDHRRRAVNAVKLR